jgi:predicted DCC family thiol-disulfide oxidoreductase YuxK
MTGHRLVVWYNTRCPVCDAGINWQRNRLLAAVRAGHITFKDINEQANLVLPEYPKIPPRAQLEAAE